MESAPSLIRATNAIPRNFLLGFNLLAVYLCWGATVPAMRVAVRSLPPFEIGAVRFLLAGALLWGFVRLRGAPLPTRRDWLGAGVTGTLLLVLGNGALLWSVRYVPSNIASLFACSAPMWMQVFARQLYGERITMRALGGIALGLAGMVYLLWPALSSAGSVGERLPLLPVVLGLWSAFAWGYGSIVGRRFTSEDLAQNSAMQMLVAGSVLAVLAWVTGEPALHAGIPHSAVAAMAFLILGGSIVGFSCYLWLVSNAETTLTSTYAFVNPIVAIGIGVAFLHEALTPHLLIAGAIIVIGVTFMVVREGG